VLHAAPMPRHPRSLLMRYEAGIAPWPKVPGTPVCILLLHIGHGRRKGQKKGTGMGNGNWTGNGYKFGPEYGNGQTNLSEIHTMTL